MPKISTLSHCSTLVFLRNARAVGLALLAFAAISCNENGAVDEDDMKSVNREQGPACNHDSCTGEDPEEMGCLDDAKIPKGADKAIYDEWSGDYLGRVRMWYSPECDAQWGEVYNAKALDWAKVALRDPETNETLSPPVFSQEVIIRTTMVATPNSGYRVDGAIEACIEGCDSGGYSWVIW